MSQSAAELRPLLESAAAGLLYSSEGDHPFEFVAFPAVPERLTPAVLGALVGAPAGARIDEVSLGRFLQHHTDCSDPYDARAQEVRPRYEALRDLLGGLLRDVRVFRVGEVRIDCYLLGRTRDGGLAGLKTVAIET